MCRTDPKPLKRGDRTPQDLAHAILAHEFSPESPAFAGVTFREQLEYNAQQR